MRKLACLLAVMALMGTDVCAQKLKLAERSLKGLSFLEAKPATIRFSYEGMSVTRKYLPEEEFLEERRSELNKEKRGKGDLWVSNWKRERERIFEPAFRAAMHEACGCVADYDSIGYFTKYEITVRISHMELGYNAAIKRRSAMIDAEATIANADEPGKVIAVISIKKSPGKSLEGLDFDATMRLQAAYVTAGTALGEYLKDAGQQ